MPTLIEKGMAVPPKDASKKVIEYYKDTKPIDIIKDWIKSRMPEYGAPVAKTLADRVLLVEAKTASGKSTTMPVELYHLLKPVTSKLEYHRPSIICTQPRVVTAQEIPKTIVNEGWAKDMVLGETIGYSTGPEKLLSKQNSLLYATIDTLLAKLRTEPYQKIASAYRFIILDEVHERSLAFDMTAMLLKKLLMDHISEVNCPFLILTSATFDIDKYAKYFNINPITNLISVMGQSQPITMNFLTQDSTNVLNSILETTIEIHENKINPMKQGENDILIFAPGANEQKEVKSKILPYNVECIAKKKKCFIILILDSRAVSTNSIEKRLIFEDYDKLTVNNEGEYDPDGKHKAYRRIILSSTVAETGLTISTLGHIIDMGIAKSMEHYAPYNIEGLLTKAVTKNSAIQRRGRVGRKFPGHFYAMYTEETWNNLEPSKLPDVVIANIDGYILDILIQQNDCFDVTKIDMIDIPPVDTLKESVEMNIVLGYIDSDYGRCFTATKMGEMYRKVMCGPESFRLIISAYVYDVCVLDIATIIAIGDKDARPRLRKVKFSEALRESLPSFFFEFEDYMSAFTNLTMDDFIKELFLVEAFMSVLEKGTEKASKWCEKVGLDLHSMMKVLEKRYEITNDIIMAELNPFYMNDCALMDSTKSNYFKRVCNIKRCLYDAYRLNVIHNDKETRNYKNRFGMPIRVMFDRELGHPQYLITDKIGLNNIPGGETYIANLNAERISVLDGYISIDDTFLNPNINSDIQIQPIDTTPIEAIDSYISILNTIDTSTLLAKKDSRLIKFI